MKARLTHPPPSNSYAYGEFGAIKAFQNNMGIAKRMKIFGLSLILARYEPKERLQFMFDHWRKRTASKVVRWEDQALAGEYYVNRLLLRALRWWAHWNRLLIANVRGWLLGTQGLHVTHNVGRARSPPHSARPSEWRRDGGSGGALGRGKSFVRCSLWFGRTRQRGSTWIPLAVAAVCSTTSRHFFDRLDRHHHHQRCGNGSRDNAS